MTTIYYVEDDRDIAENVKTYLQIRQMEVSLFYSIADAKQALLRKRPDLLLVDRNMPDGKGDELCKWIRRLWGNHLFHISSVSQVHSGLGAVAGSSVTVGEGRNSGWERKSVCGISM